jgi:hypothetical protein
MDRLPDYEQRKKEKFHKLLRKYKDEVSKNYPQRDDLLVSHYADKLRDFLKDFANEIRG